MLDFPNCAILKHILGVANKFGWNSDTLLKWGDDINKKFQQDCLNTNLNGETEINLPTQMLISIKQDLRDRDKLMNFLVDEAQRQREHQERTDKKLQDMTDLLITTNKKMDQMMALSNNFNSITLNDASENTTTSIMVNNPLNNNDSLRDKDSQNLNQLKERPIVKLGNLTTTSLNDLLLAILKDERYLNSKCTQSLFEQETFSNDKYYKFKMAFNLILQFLKKEDKTWYEQNKKPPLDVSTIEFASWNKRVTNIHADVNNIVEKIYNELVKPKKKHTLTVNMITDNLCVLGETIILDQLAVERKSGTKRSQQLTIADSFTAKRSNNRSISSVDFDKNENY